MKLIRVSTEHYVIVDENAEIKEGDWIYNVEREPSILKCVGKGSIRGWQKITHSTKPISEECKKCNGFCDVCTESCKVIFYYEIKELISEVDVEKKAINSWEGCDGCDANDELFFINGYQKGYNQAIEDKKYTEEDVRKAIAVGYDWCHQKHIPTNWMIDNFIQSLQPKTEWEVEFDSQGKIKII